MKLKNSANTITFYYPNGWNSIEVYTLRYKKNNRLKLLESHKFDFPIFFCYNINIKNIRKEF